MPTSTPSAALFFLRISLEANDAAAPRGSAPRRGRGGGWGWGWGGRTTPGNKNARFSRWRQPSSASPARGAAGEAVGRLASVNAGCEASGAPVK